MLLSEEPTDIRLSDEEVFDVLVLVEAYLQTAGVQLGVDQPNLRATYESAVRTMRASLAAKTEPGRGNGDAGTDAWHG